MNKCGPWRQEHCPAYHLSFRLAVMSCWYRLPTLGDSHRQLFLILLPGHTKPQGAGTKLHAPGWLQMYTVQLHKPAPGSSKSPLFPPPCLPISPQPVVFTFSWEGWGFWQMLLFYSCCCLNILILFKGSPSTHPFSTTYPYFCSRIRISFPWRAAPPLDLTNAIVLSCNCQLSVQKASPVSSSSAFPLCLASESPWPCPFPHLWLLDYT